MFTNEIDWDESITTVLCEADAYEDVQMFIDENEVYIRQWNVSRNEHDLIVMSPMMFAELLLALKQPEGSFHTRNKE